MGEEERLNALIAQAELETVRLKEAIDVLRAAAAIDESELRLLLKDWIVAVLRLDNLRSELRDFRGW